VLSVQPDNTDALVMKGIILGAMGQYDSALVCYRRAVEVNPQMMEAHANIGDACVEMGRYGDAVPSLKRALELRPDEPEAHYLLGVAYVRLGNLDDAREQCRILKRLGSSKEQELISLLSE
jgi:Flp pilus assembly protein TadD